MTVPGKITGGFFPASGANYSQGQEPLLAARLDALGKALGLHLTGLSGYRTPQHSVAVGGFANDPHTRGLASDTPGTETIPESTLEKYGLTRPFGGAAEADHIQILPSKKFGSLPQDSNVPLGVYDSQGNFHGSVDPKAVPPDVAAGGVSSAGAQVSAEEKIASKLLNLLWDAIGQDAVRALLYVVFVFGGLALTYQGVKRITGQGATA